MGVYSSPSLVRYTERVAGRPHTASLLRRRCLPDLFQYGYAGGVVVLSRRWWAQPAYCRCHAVVTTYAGRVIAKSAGLSSAATAVDAGEPEIPSTLLMARA